VLNRWSFFSYLITMIILLPIVLVVNHALGHDTQTLIHLKETVLMGYVIDTLIVVLSVAFLSLLLGVGTAYLTTFYHIKFSGFWVFALVLPFTIPTYVMGYIYSDIFGYFNHFHLFLRSLGITEYFNVLNIYSVIVIMSLALYPYVYLLVKASFEKSKSALLNPALSLGSSHKKVFLEIILPLSRPAIMGSIALVMMESISEYGITEYYNIKTLTPVIFNTWFGLNDSKSAAYLAVIAMVMVLVVLSVERFSRGKANYNVEDSNAQVEKRHLTRFKRFMAYAFIAFPVIFGFLIPFIWIGVYAYEDIGAMFEKEFLTILKNSFMASSVSAFIIMVLALFVAYTSRIFPVHINKYLGKFISVGFAMPGAMIAIGIIMLFADSDKWLIEHYFTKTLFLSGSLFAVIFGYIVRFSAIGINSVDANLERISLNLNSASRSFGYGYFKTLLNVELPLIKNAFLFGFVLVFISSIKELPITLVLRPFNYQTLATQTYTLANSQMLHEIAIYALSIVVLSFIPLIITVLKRKK